MAGEGGFRSYWRYVQNVNVSNGNLHFLFGPTTCVTCGGGASQGVYPSPQDTKLRGPLLVYNGLGTDPTDLGPKWMLPYHAKITTNVGNGDATLIDADGTERFYAKDAGATTPQEYTGNKERDVLTSDGTDYTLTRYDTGDRWIFGMSDGLLKSIVSRTTHTITVTWGSGRITKITDGFGRETHYLYITYGSSITRLNEIRELAPGDVGFQSTFLQYDDEGKLVAIQNPMGETSRFDWDGSDRLSVAYDGHGHATTYTLYLETQPDPSLSGEGGMGSALRGGRSLDLHKAPQRMLCCR